MDQIKSMLRNLLEILPEKTQFLVKGLYAKTVMEGPAIGLKISAFGGPKGYVNGTYETPLQNELTRLLRPGDVFYDIGANFGFFSIIAAKIVNQSGQVYAFEPVPRNAAMIRLNAVLNHFRNIKVIERAVFEEEEMQEIWITEHPGGAALTSTGVVPRDQISKLTIRTVVIDRLTDRGELRPPSMIKVDVEGAELQVLRGMSRTLKRHSPIVIYEIDDRDEKSFTLKVEQTQSFLKDLGYGTIRLEDAYPLGGSYVAHFLAEANSR